METFKPTRSRRLGTALLVASCLVAPLHAGPPVAGADPTARERSRRSLSVEEAQVLLRKGDEAYQKNSYADAMAAYAGARELLPEAPISKELRDAATTRYVQAAIAHGRELTKKGDMAGAKAAIEQVLRDDVAPNDPAALAYRAELDDPIRNNQALTAEHAQQVDHVRRLLYTAEGAFGLGQYDKAKASYEEVLRIDSHNAAARRGMERVAAARSDYQKSAYDHTRAEMLKDVEAGWELTVPPPELGPGPADPGAITAANPGEVSVAAKLKRIIIPKIALDQVSLDEALDFLRVRAAENDPTETDPARKGINITVNLGPPDSPAVEKIRAQRFDLQLSQVPLAVALKYITDITHTGFSTDDFSVIITATDRASGELVSRTYRVPPDFLTSLSSGLESSEANDDPFAQDQPKEGLLTKRLSAQEALAKHGIPFPEGALASYNAATNNLRVVNTAANQDSIYQLVSTMSQTEPVTVAVRVTMIKTQQTNLKELGFDWLVTPFAVNGGGDVFAGGGTIGNTGGRNGADFISPVDGTAIAGVPASATKLVERGVVTNGLRSGDYAIGGNSLDQIVNNPDRAVQTQSVAPGVLSVTGLFSDSQAQMVMRGLNQKKGVDIMTQPSVITRSGQASKVEIIREFIYPTEYEPPELPNSVGTGTASPATPANPTAFEKRDVGVALEVLPVADANKRYVDVTLNPSLSDFDGFVNYGTPINSTMQDLLGNEQVIQITPNLILMPVFSVHRLATQLTVADGSTIAIGGLMQERVQNVEDKVPVLGNIPWVGRLFQSTARQPVTTAVIFLVHVELLDPTGRPYRDR